MQQHNVFSRLLVWLLLVLGSVMATRRGYNINQGISTAPRLSRDNSRTYGWGLDRAVPQNNEKKNESTVKSVQRLPMPQQQTKQSAATEKPCTWTPRPYWEVVEEVMYRFE